MPDQQATILISSGLDILGPASLEADRRGMRMAYIRDGGPKSHGTMKQIEGRPQRGDIAALIIRHGAHKRRPMRILASEGIEVISVERMYICRECTHGYFVRKEYESHAC